MTMQHDTPDQSATLGADLRTLRKARGLTLSGVAERMGRSVGWLSQVERDKSQLAIAALRRLAGMYGVSVSMLFRHEAAPAHEAGHIVRRAARRPIGATIEGLTEELLSPDLTDDFEMVHSTFAPGSRITEAVQRPTQEVAWLVSGRLDVEIAGRSHTIAPGDSFRIRGEAFRWSNPYDAPAVAIWVIAPPVY
jgi:transcriptional regulator with XRE-family HTH domain